MTTQIVFTIDPKVKMQAMKRAKQAGVPFASVLKLATKAFAEGRFSVDITSEERFNAKTKREIRVALRDAEQGKNILSFKNAGEMDKYLLSL